MDLSQVQAQAVYSKWDPLGTGKLSPLVTIFMHDQDDNQPLTLSHECIHAADYLSRHRRRGCNVMEFRAYAGSGLAACFQLWLDLGRCADDELAQAVHDKGYIHYLNCADQKV